MKNFIEVHDLRSTTEAVLLVNVAQICGVVSANKTCEIVVASVGSIPVRETYQEVKALIATAQQ